MSEDKAIYDIQALVEARLQEAEEARRRTLRDYMDVKAEVERLRDGLEYVAANASGGNVPESWPEWAAGYLAELEEK